ncbi:hypothetical protein [Flocculibacter collagenilyticus]|uniref:hypothetical protein n=1 Tax=Flocculibacter collagenilyticus TaxID=2744479 RepID=UPI0018F4E003|nr:hypothetical protein [Flocculibacter collagenilyticus]
MKPFTYLTFKALMLIFFLLSNGSFAGSFKPSSKLWYLKSTLQNGTEFILLGTNHMAGELNNPQVKDIGDIMAFFKPDAVVLEGGVWEVKQSKSDAISCCGEMGLTAFLASQQDAKILTWDTTAQDDIQLLLSRYPAPVVELFFYLREIKNTSSRLKSGSDAQVLKSAWQYSQRSYQLDSKPNSVLQASELLQYLFGNTLQLADFRHFDKKIQEQPLSSLLSMKNELNQLRDEKGVNKVMQYAKENKRLLIVMGKLHFRYFMSELLKHEDDRTSD